MNSAAHPKPHVCFQFEVEKITNMSIDGNYQVQWRPTWVSKFHLVGCENLIQEFLQQQSEKQDVPERQLEISCESNEIFPQGSETSIHERDNSSAFSEYNEQLSGPDSKPDIDAVPGHHEETTEIKVSCGDAAHMESSSYGSSCFQADTANQNEEYFIDPVENHNVLVKLEDVEKGADKAVRHSPFINFPESSLLNRDVLSVTVNPPFSTMTEEEDNGNSLGQQELAPELSLPIDSNSDDKYICSTCCKHFSSEKSLTIHLRSHFTKRTYECNYCQKKFKPNSDLKAHLRTHTGEKPFICEHCGKAFRQKCHLTDHRRIHTGVKPFVCENCGKGFAQSSSRKSHMRRCVSNS